MHTFHTAGKISLPSAVLQFWDLGGQRGIRSIWPKYYGDCHAVVYVVDAVDHERLSEGWEVFGMFSLSLSLFHSSFRYHPRGQPRTEHRNWDGFQIRSSRPRRSSASRSSCWQTNRTSLSRSPSQISDTTMRSGTNTRLRARGGDRAMRWIAQRGESALPVWTSWACPR
jgi:ADP-ribosylation factor family